MLLLIPCDNPISILAVILVKAAYLEGERRPFADSDLRRVSGCGEGRGQRITEPETVLTGGDALLMPYPSGKRIETAGSPAKSDRQK
ncbi:hypothetical protein [Methanoculleus sp.]|jgi:hypothetical protein|nr:hypothetical protein [Methanoculleus sp.]